MRTPLMCLGNIISDLDFPDFQNIGVQEVLLNKKMLLAYDTGTGKTFTYALVARALLNRDPEKKHVLVIIHDSLEQVPRDLRNLVGVSVEAFSIKIGEYERLKRVWSRTSIIVLTNECFRSEEFALFLFDHLTEIESFAIDEAHHMSNWDSSDTAFMVRSLCKFVPYVVALTATPITSRASQYYRLLNLIDRNLSSRRDETPTGKYNERYLPVNREDYDMKGFYKTTLTLVDPTVEQVGHIRGIVSRVIKGTGAINQVNALIKIVKDRLSKGETVIIYVNYHDTREWVERHLLEEQISFVSLHGRITKMKGRQAILDSFREHEVNVLITSVAESLNIDSDVVIFYEFTTKLKQVMGRAHRGLEGKELELVFIITKDTAEVGYFLKYVYDRSVTIQRLLRKDYSEFIRVGRQLLNMQEEEDYN